MAKTFPLSDRKAVLVLTNKEAAEVIALLAGQLADVPVAGAQAGAAPSIYVEDPEDGSTNELVLLINSKLVPT